MGWEINQACQKFPCYDTAARELLTLAQESAAQSPLERGIRLWEQQYLEAVAQAEQNTEHQFEKEKTAHAPLETMDPSELDWDARELFSLGEDSASSNADSMTENPTDTDSAELDDFDPWELFSMDEDAEASDTDTVTDGWMPNDEIENVEAFEQSFLFGLQENAGQPIIETEQDTETTVQTQESAVQSPVERDIMLWEKQLQDAIERIGQDRLVKQGEERILAGKVPEPEQLTAMGKTKAEALGMMAVLQMEQSDGMQRNDKGTQAGDEHYLKWLDSIGAQNTELDSLEKYIEAENNSSPEYVLLTRYADDVANGWISPLSGFDNYKTLYTRIESEIVGQMVPNGIIIKGQVPHFMQRVIGTAVDPEKLTRELKIIRRSGVELTDVEEALFRPEDIGPIMVRKTGQRSIKFIGRNCVVSINPDTGMLIQTNPRRG